MAGFLKLQNNIITNEYIRNLTNIQSLDLAYNNRIINVDILKLRASDMIVCPAVSRSGINWGSIGIVLGPLAFFLAVIIVTKPKF